MNISEAVLAFDSVPDGWILVAKPPFTSQAEAQWVAPTSSYGTPQDVKDQGFQCVLDRDDIAQLVSFLGPKRVGPETVAEFVIYYAEKDAYPAWFKDLKDR